MTQCTQNVILENTHDILHTLQPCASVLVLAQTHAQAKVQTYKVMIIQFDLLDSLV